MTNLISQQMTVLIHPSSRFNGNQYDDVFVKTTIITDSPLVDEYYVPNGQSLPPAALELIRNQGLEYRPYRADLLLQGTDNIREAARSGNTAETLEDSIKLILLSALSKQPLTQVGQKDNKYVYDLTYTYKIFPLINQGLDQDYQFQVRLPFDGITMANGSRVVLTVVTPSLALVNEEKTVGIDENGGAVPEITTQLAKSAKSVVEFDYQIDPLFTVHYQYQPGSEVL